MTKNIYSLIIFSLIVVEVALINKLFTKHKKENVLISQSESRKSNYTSYYLCNEQIPLRKEVIDQLEEKIKHYQHHHNSFALLKERAQQWLPEFEKILIKHNLPTDLKYIPIVESALSNVESPAHANGYWQLMPSTAVNLGLTVNDSIDERLDPIKSTYAASKYLQTAQKSLPNWPLRIASYNSGIGRINKKIKYYNTDDFFALTLNKETTDYIYKIIAIKYLFETDFKPGNQTVEAQDFASNSSRIDNTLSYTYDMNSYLE